MFYIQNLNFRYDKNLKLLENISFSANHGDIIWLKGVTISKKENCTFRHILDKK